MERKRLSCVIRNRVGYQPEAKKAEGYFSGGEGSDNWHRGRCRIASRNLYIYQIERAEASPMSSQKGGVVRRIGKNVRIL